jgi:O-antigen ligase
MQIALGAVIAAVIITMTAAGYASAATLGGYLAVGLALVAPPVGLSILLIHAPLQELTGFGPLAFHGDLVAAILLGCLASLRSERVQVHFDLLWAIFLAFGGFALIQVLAIRADVLGEQQTFASIQLVGLAAGGGLFLAAQFLTRNRDWGPFLDLIIASGVLAGGLALASFATNGAIESTIPALFVQGITAERAIGPFQNSNYFGLFTAIAFIVAVYRTTSVHGVRRALTVAAAVVIFVAVVLSFSRGALLAIAVGLIGLAFSRGVRLGLSVTAICVVLGVALSGDFLHARLNVTNPNQLIDDQVAAQASSDEARFTAGSVGFVLFARDPIFGVGFGQYHFVSPFFLPPGSPAISSHNWYINVLAEQGLVGVSLVALAAVGVVGRVARSDPTRRALGLSVLAAYAVGNVFTESPTYLATSAAAWFVVGATLGRSAHHDDGVPQAVPEKPRPLRVGSDRWSPTNNGPSNRPDRVRV